MSANKTAQGIEVRKVPFEFPPDFQPHWHPTDPALSQLINGTSLLLPYMEPFIIDAIRQASEDISDPALKKEAKAWIGQESQHFMQHRRFNEVLIANGYPQLREREKEIEQEYELLRKRPLKFQIAYTAGFETMALAIGHTIIADRAHLLRRADPALASLFLWHVMEEIEHKNVAFDVYQHVHGVEPRVHEITRQLIVSLKSQTEGDLVSTLSGPLPTTVIAEMLGVEAERLDDFKRWSDDVVLGTSRPTDEAVRDRVRKSGAALRAYFERLIERHRTDPGEDVITALVRAEEERDMLSASEILALAVLLLLAGNETTTNLIGNAVRNLLEQPTELAKVRADRTLVPSLVEEVLRYDSPVQLIPRRTAREVELEGGKIPAGAIVFLLLGAANRDERKFPEPDRFDVTRNPQDHVAFGYGIHYCLGAPLARLEGRIALDSLLFDCPSFTCTRENLPQIASIVVRGVQTLPLRFETTRRAVA